MTFPLREFSPLILCAVVMVAVQCVAGHLPPPENLSYKWLDPFRVNVSWQEPKDLPQDCKTKYLVTSTDQKRIDGMSHVSCITTEEMGPDGLTFTVVTVTESKDTNESCGSLNTRKSSTISIGRQEKLVEDFNCVLYAKDTMKCSWKPAAELREPLVFYGLCENYTETQAACEQIYNCEDMRCCDLKVGRITYEVCILMKGTLNDSPVRNTFKRRPNHHVKIPPPELKITEEGRNLSLSWSRCPDVAPDKHGWLYTINYSKCDESHTLEYRNAEKTTIPYDKRCRYTFQIMSTLSQGFGKGGSDFSQAETYGEDEPPDWLLTVAVIVIPAILSVCVILSCYCFRRHRDIICPIVPDPSVIFKEMMMNRSKESKTAPRNLYIPVPEVVESCKIALVDEVKPPQQNS